MSRRIVYKAINGISHYEFPYDTTKGFRVTVQEGQSERVLTEDVDYTLDCLGGGAGGVVYIINPVEEGAKVVLESWKSSPLAVVPTKTQKTGVPDVPQQQQGGGSLDEETRKLISDLVSLSKGKEGDLVARQTPNSSTCNINFVNSEGAVTARIRKTPDWLKIGNVVTLEDGSKILKGAINISPNGDLLFNGIKLIEWLDPASSLRKNINAITPQEVLSLLQGRTVLMPMNNYGLSRYQLPDGNYKFTTECSWYFPGEDSSGYMGGNDGYSRRLTEEEASKTWRCVGSSWYSYKSSGTAWFQEVIDPDATILRAVGSSTLQDNLIDLKAISSKIQDILP
ncbi:hypothetical protein, partial [Candidatus Liberibacter sp.]|uniref:hypothetical protein n=1 Tax=Candidatus Liberibacter sp. TaxID=34022 RepID=UPI0015F5F335